jgi:DNA-binding CsgD family transcriptional regulator
MEIFQSGAPMASALSSDIDHVESPLPDSSKWAQPPLPKMAPLHPITLAQLFDGQIRTLNAHSLAVHTRAQLWAWVRGPLRDAVPHQYALLAFGRGHSLGVKLCDVVAVDLMDTYLHAIHAAPDEMNSPVLERWLTRREMMHVTASGLAMMHCASWLHNFESHGLRNVLVDGWVEENANDVALLKLYNCHPHALAALTVLRDCVRQAVHAMWARITQSEALTRTDKLRIVSALTPAEREVMQWVKYGKTNTEIALILGKSEHTVKTQVHKILGKTGAVNRTALALFET